MIYFCADDYGLNHISSMRIQQCIEKGVLNKVSVFPNLDRVDIQSLLKDKSIRVSLHLNFVEGKCMSDSRKIDLIAEENGNFKHTFGGLFILGIFKRKTLETQIYEEIKAQVLFWKSILPEDVPFCIDSHQHTHMIPAVFKALLKVLRDEKIKPEYIRIPAEPILPYLKTPSLYLSYTGVNIIKQWLLKFLRLVNNPKKHHIPTSDFMGILFSGKMDEKRVCRVLKKYEKDGRDIEVLFHPGYLDKSEIDLTDKNIVFENFYFSENRKTEFDCIMKISERSVL